MIKELRTLSGAEPACQNMSEKGHLRFVIHEKRTGDYKFGFTLELSGTRTWVVADVPSMDPLDQHQRPAREDQVKQDQIHVMERSSNTWDKGNYIPIDDRGNVLNESQAIDCLEEGSLKFFLQGKKLVGEFVLMKKSLPELVIDETT